MDKAIQKKLNIKRYSQSNVPLESGEFTIAVYRDNKTSLETLAIYKGPINTTEKPVFVRLHSECLTGEVLGSLKCDCKNQLNLALETIEKEGSGVVIYLRQEGRGIGLGNKIKAYNLQEQGYNTIEANHLLGFPTDMRDFSIAALILKDLGVKKINLNTNNPDKINALKEAGVEIENILPSYTPIQEFNKNYLITKKKELGHSLKIDENPKSH